MRETGEEGHDDVVVRQFGPRANAYVTSPTHSSGPDLDRLGAIAAAHPAAHVLDLGCGGGHAAYRVAPLVAHVTAADLSAEMLVAVKAEAARRGLANIATAQAPAERLPFADGAFDLVVCRLSAHHWRDLEAGLREARRVIRPSGCALFIDVVAPANPLLDTHLQAVEVLRDPSHVRDYRADEWLAALGRAGFALTGYATHRLRMEFAMWIARMQTPPVHADAIRSLQKGAAEPIRAAFAIGEDGSFDIEIGSFELVPV